MPRLPAVTRPAIPLSSSDTASEEYSGWSEREVHNQVRPCAEFAKGPCSDGVNSLFILVFLRPRGLDLAHRRPDQLVAAVLIIPRAHACSQLRPKVELVRDDYSSTDCLFPHEAIIASVLDIAVCSILKASVAKPNYDMYVLQRVFVCCRVMMHLLGTAAETRRWR